MHTKGLKDLVVFRCRILSGSPRKEKSQLKSPSRKIFSDLNQAFSSGVIMRLKKWLSSGGL